VTFVSLFDIVYAGTQVHTSPLAFEANFFGMVIAVCVAAIVAVLCWRRQLPTYYYYVAASLLFRALYSAMLTISAGQDPIFSRAEIAQWIRVTGVLSSLSLIAWVFFLVRERVCLTWRRKADAC